MIEKRSELKLVWITIALGSVHGICISKRLTPMYFNKNGFPPSHVLDSNEVVSGQWLRTVQQQIQTKKVFIPGDCSDWKKMYVGHLV